MEIDIQQELLEKYINLIHSWSGIYFTNSNISVLKRKIISQAKHEGVSLEDYLSVITRDEEKMMEFVDSITTNFTKFFRHYEQFEFIKNKIIPELSLKREQQGIYKIKAWSAGCATGEEPYSMLISFLESFEENNIKSRLEVIASDISLKCLEIAQKGIYNIEKLQDVPQYIVSKYFSKFDQNKVAVKEELKKYLRFDYHNLLHDNGIRNVDIVMCRNVLIYMDEESVKKVIENIYLSMNPDGYLFLSPTESLFGVTDKFKSLKDGNVFFYQKKV
ncbi:MAG: protein-glutamate O-methyltransferase CheR [Brevinematales bacterium]|nr:protein-glutamate O-methyltransferase CheR [Brevinematales bacterium]